MKPTSLADLVGTDESSDERRDVDDQIADAIDRALASDDKVIEIRPATQSSRMGLRRLLMIAVAAVAVAYWARSSQKPDELVDRVKEKTADRTRQAAETIEEGSETASERIEESSEQAGEAVQEAGETVAERTEEAGEKAAEEADDDGGHSQS